MKNWWILLKFIFDKNKLFYLPIIIFWILGFPNKRVKWFLFVVDFIISIWSGLIHSGSCKPSAIFENNVVLLILLFTMYYLTDCTILFYFWNNFELAWQINRSCRLLKFFFVIGCSVFSERYVKNWSVLFWLSNSSMLGKTLCLK